MLRVHKVGASVYQNREDTNSGLFEYEMLKNELRSWYARSNIRKNVLVVVGGYLKEEEKEIINSLVHGSFDVKIFIATDYVAISTCIEYINEFDYLLTQATEDILTDKIKIEQYYNFIPELFYKHTKKCVNDCAKSKKIIFGGADTGREDMFAKYNLKDTLMFDLFAKVNSTGEDNRIKYQDFIRLLNEHKFTIVFGRKQYRDIGWVTSRFYESIANFCVPFVDSSFYKNDNLRLKNCLFRDFIVVESYVEMLFKRSLLIANEKARVALLEELRASAECYKDGFIKLIDTLARREK